MAERELGGHPQHICGGRLSRALSYAAPALSHRHPLAPCASCPPPPAPLCPPPPRSRAAHPGNLRGQLVSSADLATRLLPLGQLLLMRFVFFVVRTGVG